MSVEEKLKVALAHKDSGNDAFKKGDIKQALTQYHLAVLGLSGLDNNMSNMGMLTAMGSGTKGTSATDSEKNEIKTNLAIVYSNMAACHLKNQNYKRAIEVSNSALKHDPKNIKAKFRRAQAKLLEGNLSGAESDLLDLGEGVPGVKAELDRLRKRFKEAEEQQKKTMGGFLSRGRIINEEKEQQKESNSASANDSGSGSSSQPSSTSTSTSTTSPKTTPKSKPTLASKMNAGRKPKPVPREEEYVSTWSGTAPKIQELADGEE
ncbi:hypothetical protein BGZ94_002774 [Podila epigama]|nr:hypothetical protein BGZ94_002774 [Podila epigama]